MPALTDAAKIAFIVPRFAAELGGGAEALVRSIALELKAVRGDGEGLEVWTTCARDHRTWDNFYPPGMTVEDGLSIRRFPVGPRDLEPFIQAEFAMRDGRRLSIAEQLDWLANGVNSPELYAHIAAAGECFDALLFAPYLFPTSFWGALIHPSRSIIIPCLHDEHYAYQPVFRSVFEAVRGLIFNTPEEMELAASIFRDIPVLDKGCVVGMGFAGNGRPSEPAVQPSEVPEIEQPFVLYSGRKERGKNLDRLIDWFETIPELSQIKLVLIGAGEVDFRERLPENVLDLGFVSEGRKTLLMEQALCLCQPSTNESFSIVIMESWLKGTPVLVHAGCPVTRGHVVRSGGGLFFANGAEFGAVVRTLVSDPELRRSMGQSGRRYVLAEYAWPAVIARLTEAFRRFDMPPPASVWRRISAA